MNNLSPSKNGVMFRALLYAAIAGIGVLLADPLWLTILPPIVLSILKIVVAVAGIIRVFIDTSPAQQKQAEAAADPNAKPLPVQVANTADDPVPTTTEESDQTNALDT